MPTETFENEIAVLVFLALHKQSASIISERASSVMLEICIYHPGA